VADLLVQPQAVEVAQLQEDSDGLFAGYISDRDPPSVEAGGG